MNNGYRKENNCPYCGYFCDSAMLAEDKNASQKPNPGDLTFCLMCCESGTFDENMKIQKFDLNSIKESIERNRLKRIQFDMRQCWESLTKEEQERRNKFADKV